MGSFSTPLSGLTAAQQQLQAVSNNLANIDTDGYKDGTLTFSDVFSQVGSTNGSGDPVQIGSGVSVASLDSNFTDGTVNSTGTASNMALSGNGFFVTEGSGGVQEYTRSGDFTTNKSGQLVTPNGDLVQGYPAVGGVVNTSASLQALQVSNLTTPAVASTTVGITANITSSTTIGDTATSSTAPVYDSLGTSHTLSVSYTKTAANTWAYTVTVPSADLTTATAASAASTAAVVTGATAGSVAAAVTGATGATAASIAVATAAAAVTGATAGSVASAVASASTAATAAATVFSAASTAAATAAALTGATASTVAAAVTAAAPTPVNTTVSTGTLNFDTSGALLSTSTMPAISITGLADGAADISLTGLFGTATAPTITQTSSASTTSATATDGLASGTLKSYAVDSDGTVEGTFSNGKTLALGQVAVASFANNQGLASVGNNSYEPTNASGSAVIGVAGTGGRGTITGGSVEASNVDIATEFSKLIVAQQAYSANAKAVTTFSTISQATLQMIQ